MAPKPNTVLAYEGPSLIDRAPLFLFVTGLTKSSTNSKTGGMVQTYILRADQEPLQALRTGADKSICGGCPLRPDPKERKAGRIRRACYVRVDQAPTNLYRTFQRGRIPRMDLQTLQQILAGRRVRLGTYGDPAAIPIAVWDTLLAQVLGWTGYTHQWRAKRFQALQRYCQASVESVEDLADAVAAGWGTFRVVPPSEAPAPTEMRCPASAEMGHAVTCEQCMRCDGESRTQVVIAAHGSGARNLPVLTGLVGAGGTL